MNKILNKCGVAYIRLPNDKNIQLHSVFSWPKPPVSAGSELLSRTLCFKVVDVGWSFCVIGAVVGEFGGWHLLLRIMKIDVFISRGWSICVPLFLACAVLGEGQGLLFVIGAIVGEILMSFFSWQVQYLVKLKCNISWKVQYLVKA